MRSVLHSLLVSALLAVSATAVAKQLATITPEKPRRGDTLVITYSTAYPKAKLAEAREITLEMLVLRDGEAPLLAETLMTKKGTVFTASMVLNQEKAVLVLYRFICGDLLDDNGENTWTVMVYDKDRPVRAARQQLASILRGGIDEWPHERDIKGALALLNEERTEFPDNWRARTLRWSIMLRENDDDATKASIRAELNEVYGKFSDDEEVVPSLLSWFERTDQKDRAAEIRKSMIAKRPKGKIAEGAALNAIYNEKNGPRRADLIETFLEEFKLSDQTRDKAESMLVSAAVDGKQIERALKAVEAMHKPDPMAYNSLAWELIQENTMIGKAIELARKGSEILRLLPRSSRPPTLTRQSWTKEQLSQLAQLLHTFATALDKSGDLNQAVMFYQEAFLMSAGEDRELVDAYLEAVTRLGRNEQILELCRNMVRFGRSDEKIEATFKKAYAEMSGDATGAEKEIGALKEEARGIFTQKVQRDRIDKPAPDFALKDLRGKTVKLSSLKGKIVILDFWATWCGPCKASFPFLQKIYERYKKDPRIRIFAIDTWENEKGEKRMEIVKKFIEENKYTFPVLFDDKVVDAYGVTGIPTKFIVGSNGRIQFRTVGFNGGDEMMSILPAQLDVLLKEDTPK